jgi:hypothetical protein
LSVLKDEGFLKLVRERQSTRSLFDRNRGISESELKIAVGVRLGYPESSEAKHLRVRRDVEDFTYNSRFDNQQTLVIQNQMSD